MSDQIDYDKIMSDRSLFNKTVYTPLSEALKLIEVRNSDNEFLGKVNEILKGDIPPILKEKKCGVLGRHIATPNHENRMFIEIASQYDLRPVFFEYYDDKFISQNSYKHSLGQLMINQDGGISKEGDYLFDRINIVDFNENGGKKLKDVKTFWQEPLVDFHKRLFSSHNYGPDDFYSYDGSEWFKRNGNQKAVDFYTNFLMLFTCHGILFENFLTTDDSDGDFTRTVVLPAIKNVERLTGVRPLIIPIGPLEIETDSLWFHHLPTTRGMIPDFKHD